jgi:hypothetical protein
MKNIDGLQCCSSASNYDKVYPILYVDRISTVDTIMMLIAIITNICHFDKVRSEEQTIMMRETIIGISRSKK